MEQILSLLKTIPEYRLLTAAIQSGDAAVAVYTARESFSAKLASSLKKKTATPVNAPPTALYNRQGQSPLK